MPINYKDYPENWKTEIRPKIIKRANNKCELCYAPNNMLVLRPQKNFETNYPFYFTGQDTEKMKWVKIILTIHHIDFDKTNNDEYNLIALCQRCHLKLDMGYKLKNKRRVKK